MESVRLLMALARAKGARGRADRAFSKLIRARGQCEKCGRTEFLQCAHIVSRRYSATRVDLENALCLCAKCHRYFTDHPIEWAQFVGATIGMKNYNRLKGKAEASGKFGKKFWESEAKRLEHLVKVMEAAA